MGTVASATADLDQHTYLPDPVAALAPVHDLMAQLESGRERPPARYLLLSESEGGEQVELPPEVYRVLRQVVDAMAQNLAVTVVPTTQTLTTQQAADLLGVSRPTLVRLCDDGKLPFERPGAHRRIRLRDLLDYRERMRERQYAALAETSGDLDDEEDVEVVLDRLRSARRAAAGRRREARAEA
ncbi:helix-turn-helix domain-containing protein [Pseudokineococcus sp. 1T1Z-3]|uniref:helix-turn-helix domain-containing protein n=1 Tax=Pseudokineococcus sp. 1T1Z-3 TaxID=3132745 RepID=UPI0030ABC0A3